MSFSACPSCLHRASHAAERYKVKSGDSLHKIAKAFNVSVDALKEANHLEGNALKPNQVLVIPGTSSKKSAAKNAKKKKNTPDATVYVVKKGDTLAGVAERTGVHAAEIRKMNELRSAKLKTGQKLVLEKAATPVEEDEDDLEEAGSIEAGELAASAENPGQESRIAPVDLSGWKEPGERDLFRKGCEIL